MSTDVTRIIEVRVSTSKGTSYKYETLVSKYSNTAEEGDYFDLYENGKHYVYKFTNGNFVKTNEKIPKVWKLVKFYSDFNIKDRTILDSEGEHSINEAEGVINNLPVISTNYWYDCGGSIRDNYISGNGWDKQDFTNRGLPDDISKEAYELIKPESSGIFSDYKYDKTWVTLSEWQELFDKKEIEFKSKLNDLYSKKNLELVNNKLSKIMSKLEIEDINNNEDEYSIDEQIEDLWENEYYDLISIRTEIAKNYALADHFCNTYIDYKDIRVLYYLS